MKVHFLKIDKFSVNGIRFFTVRLGNNNESEFEKFVNKPLEKTHKEEIDILFSILEYMQNEGEAYENLFVKEENAHYLPVVSSKQKDKNKVDWGVRLYCVRLRDDLVILFNGGIKTDNKPQHCKNVQTHFSQALAITRKIDKAIFNRDLDLDDSNPFEEFEIDI